VLGCLDSRAARRSLAAAAWHVGALAYIDAGVEPTGLLVRVDAYVAGAEAPCFECAWSAASYAAQEQRYPCDGDADAAGSAPPTDAPSGLGALAAALQAVECRKLLEGHLDRALVGRQVVLDASWHKHYVTTMRRNPVCRFDHEAWHIDASSPICTIDDVLAASGASSDVDASLCVPGQTFVRRLTCTACKRSCDLVCLSGRLLPVTTSCAACGQRMVAAGFDMADRLRIADLPAATRRGGLRSLGLRRGDVVAIRSAQADRYFLVGTSETRARAVRAE